MYINNAWYPPSQNNYSAWCVAKERQWLLVTIPNPYNNIPDKAAKQTETVKKKQNTTDLSNQTVMFSHDYIQHCDIVNWFIVVTLGSKIFF